MENEGVILPIKTTNILESIELEKFTADEIREIKSSIGEYNAYI